MALSSPFALRKEELDMDEKQKLTGVEMATAAMKKLAAVVERLLIHLVVAKLLDD